MFAYKSATFKTALVILLIACCSCGGGERGDTMPVVLITVDGLVPDQLSLFGGPKATPALEELANDGYVFRDVWTTAPMTRPAVATYLTGLAPDRHGMRDEIHSILPEGVPTLATLLAEKGYRSAAFPNSSFLGQASGLLSAFEVVDDPPQIPIGAGKMLPLARSAQHSANNFELWLTEIESSSNYFAWFHFSGPLLDQMMETFEVTYLGPAMREKRKAKREVRIEQSNEEATTRGENVEPQGKGKGAAKGKGKQWAKGVPPDDGRAVEAFDDALATILETLEERGDLKSALIIVAGTSADISGGNGARGPGFSLDEQAINVPLVVLFPAGSPAPRSEDGLVWAPDIAATVAQLAGVELAVEAEGRSLLEQVEDDRIIYSWSWATQDQMGWLPLRAVRSGNIKFLQGVDDELVFIDGEEPAEWDEGRLLEAIAGRAEPHPPIVDISQVRPWLEERGLAIDPLPPGGRAFADKQKRRQASDFLWKGRIAIVKRFRQKVPIHYNTAAAADPDAFGPMFELSQAYTLAWADDDEERMRPVVEKYPYSFDALHWYAHSIWNESWAEAEKMVDILLTYSPNDQDLLYDKACARSLAGDIPQSIEFLETAIQAGFENWSIIQSDRDLRNLRERPEFSELMRNYGR